MEQKAKKKTGKRKLNVRALKRMITAAVLFVSVFKLTESLVHIAVLKKEIAQQEILLQQVTDRNTELLKEKARLQDPEYVQYYGRGKFLLSKDDEQIFVIDITE